MNNLPTSAEYLEKVAAAVKALDLLFCMDAEKTKVCFLPNGVKISGISAACNVVVTITRKEQDNGNQ